MPVPFLVLSLSLAHTVGIAQHNVVRVRMTAHIFFKNFRILSVLLSPVTYEGTSKTIYLLHMVYSASITSINAPISSAGSCIVCNSQIANVGSTAERRV